MGTTDTGTTTVRYLTSRVPCEGTAAQPRLFRGRMGHNRRVRDPDDREEAEMGFLDKVSSATGDLKQAGEKVKDAL
jgi:hypothetical protein